MSTQGKRSELWDKIKSMKKNIFIFVILSIAAFTACVDEVHIDQDFNETQKLVLYCRLCPQLDTTYILLTNTTLLYASSNTAMMNLKDGVVELSADGQTWTRAAYDQSRQHFFLTKEEFPIEEGHTYYIRASHPDFEDVSSSCTVPVAHDVGFRFDTVTVNSDMHLDFGDGSGSMVTSYYWDFYTVWMYRNNQDYRYVSDEGNDGAVMRFLVDENLPIEGEGDWDDEEDEGGEIVRIPPSRF